jgi:membrane-associated HD superfamily phosphohydrolase
MLEKVLVEKIDKLTDEERNNLSGDQVYNLMNPPDYKKAFGAVVAGIVSIFAIYLLGSFMYGLSAESQTASSLTHFFMSVIVGLWTVVALYFSYCCLLGAYVLIFIRG